MQSERVAEADLHHTTLNPCSLLGHVAKLGVGGVAGSECLYNFYDYFVNSMIMLLYVWCVCVCVCVCV